MLKNRFFAMMAAAALVSFAACDQGDDVEGEGEVADDVNATAVTPVVDQDTALAPVVTPVVTGDTGAVVTEVEADVDVDRDVVGVEGEGEGAVQP